MRESNGEAPSGGGEITRAMRGSPRERVFLCPNKEMLEGERVLCSQR
jgi:hypothetical protein